MPDQLTVSADSLQVFLIEGGPATARWTVTNHTHRTVPVAPTLSVPDGFRARVEPRWLLLRPGQSQQVSARIVVLDRSMPRGTLTLHAGDAYDWISMLASDNWVRVATVSASSHVERGGGYYPRWAKDGFSYDDFRWGSWYGWNDGTPHEFPDWFTARWEQPVTLSMVRVYTVDTPRYPAAEYGVRDYDLQVDAGQAWQTVARVRGNVKGVIESEFPEVRTRALRINIRASNDDKYSRLVEFEAYGPGGRPHSSLQQLYGGPGGISVG